MKTNRFRSQRARFRPAVEALEDRSLLSASSLVVASYFDGAVYDIDPSTGAVLHTLVAPYSQATLSGPAGLTVGADGALYFSSQDLAFAFGLSPTPHDSIVRFDPSAAPGQQLSTFID